MEIQGKTIVRPPGSMFNRGLLALACRIGPHRAALPL